MDTILAAPAGKSRWDGWTLTLDLCTVIYISGILVNESYIAINFARKEVAGLA